MVTKLSSLEDHHKQDACSAGNRFDSDAMGNLKKRFHSNF